MRKQNGLRLSEFAQLLEKAVNRMSLEEKAEMREAMKNREIDLDGDLCRYCGVKIQRNDRGTWFHVQHRIPRRHGGLPTLCERGDTLATMQATPYTVLGLTQTDREFLRKCGIAVEPEQSEFMFAIRDEEKVARLDIITKKRNQRKGIAPRGTLW